MKKNINMRLKIFGAIAILFIIVNIVITFAYIRGNSENIESVSTIALEGAILKVVYSGNSENIVANDILPGFEADKSFTITSDFGAGNENYHIDLWYEVMLIVEENDFNDNYIKYSLTVDEASDNDGTVLPSVSNVGIPNGPSLDGVIIGSGKFYSHNKSHIYNLNISYPDNGEDQTDQIGNKFAAYLVLSRPNFINVTFDLDGGKFTDYRLDENSSKKVAEYALLEPPAPIKGGYIFSGWSVVDGRADVMGNNSIKFYSESVTLKAVYEQSIYPIFTYLKSDGTDANYLLIKDTDYDWRIKFKESGTLTFEDIGNAYFDNIDVFLVGGGAGGGPGYWYEIRNGWGGNATGYGGGGGYTNTVKDVAIETSKDYNIVVGAGGGVGENGGASSGFGYTANGGNEKNGGSGGGREGIVYSNSGGSGGSDGGNSSCGTGTGQGTTTREFGESTGDLYSPGGAGGGSSAWDGGYVSGGSHGAGLTGANSGSGGDGSDSGYSGIVIIRNGR